MTFTLTMAVDGRGFDDDEGVWTPTPDILKVLETVAEQVDTADVGPLDCGIDPQPIHDRYGVLIGHWSIK